MNLKKRIVSDINKIRLVQLQGVIIIIVGLKAHYL